MLLRLSDFQGIMPARDERGLPLNAARAAENIDFDGGQMRAVRATPNPLTSAIVTNLQVIALGNGASNPTRMLYYKTRDGNSYLLRFDGSTYHAAPGQVNGDRFNRVYFTAYTLSDNAYAGFNDASPQNSGRTLNVIEVTGPSATPKLAGLPTPTNIPTATDATSGTSVAVSSFAPAGITRASPPVVTTAVPHGFETGDTVKLTMNTVAGPGVTLGMTELAGKEFEIEVLTSTTFELSGIDTTDSDPFLPIQAPTTFFKKVYASSDVEDRVYVYTIVNAYGEESAPSQPSALVTVPEEDGRVTLATGALPDYTGYVTASSVRFYRTVTGADTGTRYLFVKEAAIPGAMAAGVTMTDDVRDAALGEPLSTEDFELPPRGLSGLIALPNGMFAGYYDRTVYICEPYQPCAWPRGYRRTVDAKITAMGVFGSTLVVTTETGVYYGSGTDPSSMSLRKTMIDAPCLKPDMLVSVGYGVVYPSSDGLVLLNDESPRVLTEKLFNKQQWQALLSGWSSAGWHDGKYYAFSATTGQPSYVFDLANDMRVSTLVSTDSYRAGCIWPPTDQFVVTLPSSGSKNPVTLLDNNTGAYRTAKWISKLFTFNGFPNWGALQVLADFALPDGRTRLTPGTVYVNLYPGKYVAGAWSSELSQSAPEGACFMTVTSPEPVRLPALCASREWTVEIGFDGAAGNVTDVLIGEHMSDLNDG